MTIKTRMPEFAILVAVMSVATVGCTPTKNDFVAPPPPTVKVATPVRAPVKMVLERTGNTEAVEEAVVSSRVRGFIEDISFKPGDRVEAGAQLYVIEKNQYQAKKDSAAAAVSAATAAIAVAKGRVETVEAEVSRSQRDFDRQALLKQQMATSEAEYESALAAKEAAEANLVSAKAEVQAAEAAKQEAEAVLVQAQQDLDYTDVKAPIAGRITKTDVKLGNLIEDGQNLATIVNRDQVFANFTISDRQALRLQKMKVASDPETKGSDPERWYETQVFMRRETDDEFRFEGYINNVDQQGIDRETGTIDVRAIFDNPDDLLLSGLFVYLRIPYGDEVPSLLIPEEALSRNNQGSFVLLVGDNNEVVQRSVTTGAKLDGWVVIEQGLSDDEKIVVQGLQRARPGAQVDPQPTTLTVEGSPFIGSQQSDAESGAAASGRGAGQPEANESGEDAAGNAPDDSSKS